MLINCNMVHSVGIWIHWGIHMQDKGVLASVSVLPLVLHSWVGLCLLSEFPPLLSWLCIISSISVPKLCSILLLACRPPQLGCASSVFTSSWLSAKDFHCRVTLFYLHHIFSPFKSHCHSVSLSVCVARQLNTSHGCFILEVSKSHTETHSSQ
jgi:hypothetical protein